MGFRLHLGSSQGKVVKQQSFKNRWDWRLISAVGWSCEFISLTGWGHWMSSRAGIYSSLAGDLNQAEVTTKLPVQTRPSAWLCRWAEQLAGTSAQVRQWRGMWSCEIWALVAISSAPFSVFLWSSVVSHCQISQWSLWGETRMGFLRNSCNAREAGLPWDLPHPPTGETTGPEGPSWCGTLPAWGRRNAVTVKPLLLPF